MNSTTSATSATDLLLTVAEPTRLRILNCLAAAPLFVSDLQAVLDLPQPTVSRHLQVLRRADLVRDTPIAQFVLYRLRRDLGAHGPPARRDPGRGRHDDPRCAPSATARRTGAARTRTARGRARRRQADDPREEARMTHRILVVDDEPDITALVAYHLAKAGYRVSTAANGPDALKAAREERPDIVILDLMLPGRLGLRRAGRAPPAGRDPRRRRHPAHRAAGGGRPHPRPLARRRRLPHQAVLAAGAVAPGARPAPPAGRARR